MKKIIGLIFLALFLCASFIIIAGTSSAASSAAITQPPKSFAVSKVKILEQQNSLIFTLRYNKNNNYLYESNTINFQCPTGPSELCDNSNIYSYETTKGYIADIPTKLSITFDNKGNVIASDLEIFNSEDDVNYYTTTDREGINIDLDRAQIKSAFNTAVQKAAAKSKSTKAKRVTGDGREIYQSVSESYGPIIDKYTSENSMDSELLYVIIRLESGGDKYAVSPTSCIGLTQLCPQTALQFKSLFNTKNIITCGKIDKTGKTKKEINEAIKKDCLKNIDKDARFDPEKAIQGGILTYKDKLRHFTEYTDKEKFAIASYNGGQTTIKNAIAKAKKEFGIDDPYWEQVAPFITVDLLIKSGYNNEIGYFGLGKGKGMDMDKLKNKTVEIQDYVPYVGNFKKQADLYFAITENINLNDQQEAYA